MKLLCYACLVMVFISLTAFHPAVNIGDTGIACIEADGNDVSVMQSEADSFLRRMPEGLQQRQTEAIRAAIAGNPHMLDAVRNSRNTAAILPDGVYRRDIGDRITLFRSKNFDNDSIPLLIYLHGGGWTIGSVNSCSKYCAAMAEKGVAVLAVDYSLAPERPFPAGLNDCIRATELARDSLSAWKCRGLSIGGDSSGGNLAITTAMSLPRGTFKSLIAFYPVVKAYADGSPSWTAYGEGYALDSGLMEAFNDSYTSDIRNPFISPADAPDDILLRLPPILFIAAERDILRSQGADFIKRMRHLDIPATYIMLPATVHLFITVDGQPTAFCRAVEESSRFLLDK